jgi:molybdopterin molybdotransferase
VLTVAEARERILAGLAPVACETVGIGEAFARVLARSALARLTQPPDDVSAMDGYALRAQDAGEGAKLRVIGAAPAGQPFSGAIGPGETVRLFTGSVIPPGADSVLLQEDADASDGCVRVKETPRPGQHIRRQGQDFAAGDMLLAPGTRLSARDIGLLAAANHPFVTVRRRPRVAILATGDEISLPGEPVRPGGIISSNTLVLAAMVKACGGEPVLLPLARDDAAEIAAAAGGAAGCDLLVTTGGASVGDHDLVRPALEQAGFLLEFWRIAMRPGKPMMFGSLDGLPVVGLPGNPVSSFVCGVLFVLPALARLAGLAEPGPVVEQAVLGAPVKANDRRADHLRATLNRRADGVLVATPFARQDSALQRVLAEAKALILRPPFAPAAEPGAPAEIIRLDGFGL